MNSLNVKKKKTGQLPVKKTQTTLCRLCGKHNSGCEKRKPCTECRICYPDYSPCYSCGRIFPNSDRFQTDKKRCQSCVNRRKKETVKEGPIRKRKQLMQEAGSPPCKTEKKELLLKVGDHVFGKIYLASDS